MLAMKRCITLVPCCALPLLKCMIEMIATCNRLAISATGDPTHGRIVVAIQPFPPR